MSQRIVLLMLLAGSLAGCAQTTLNSSITVTNVEAPGERSGTLKVDGTNFPKGPACADVALSGMPNTPSIRSIGTASCSTTDGSFHLEWAYALAGVDCVPSQAVQAVVLADAINGTNAGASQTLSMPWGANCMLAAQTRNAPITYTLEVLPDADLSGSLGSYQISNGSDIIFTYVGDTSNVIPFAYDNVPGYEILGGTATIQITDQVTGAVVNASIVGGDIFVGVDNENVAVAFGSAGMPPWDPGFPTQTHVAYPMGMGMIPKPNTPYNLQSSIKVVGATTTCPHFPPDINNLNACNGQAGFPIPTTAGPLILNTVLFSDDYAIFEAQPGK